MFYCTLYQETSGTDKVRVALSFSEEQEALNAETEIIQAAKKMGAKIEEHKDHWYNFRKVKMIGHINYPGPDSNEIFIVDTNKKEKVYYTVIETDKTLGSERRLYHPIKSLIVDGKEFLQRHTPKTYSADWYDELSDINN